MAHIAGNQLSCELTIKSHLFFLPISAAFQKRFISLAGGMICGLFNISLLALKDSSNSFIVAQWLELYYIQNPALDIILSIYILTFNSNYIPNCFLRLSSWQLHKTVKLFLQRGGICSAISKLSLLQNPITYCTIHMPGIHAGKHSEVEGYTAQTYP